MRSVFIRICIFVLGAWLLLAQAVAAEGGRIIFCADIHPRTQKALNEKSAFTVDEKMITACAELENLEGGKRIRFSWFTPSGELYGERFADISPLPGGMRYPHYRAWNSIIIRTNRAAWLPGVWKVAVQLDSAPIAESTFTLEKKGEQREKAAPPFRTISPVSVQSTLYGRVIDVASGKPLAGAKITCGPMQAESSENGLYLLSGIMPGTADIRVQAPGYYECRFHGEVQRELCSARDLPMEHEASGAEPLLVHIYPADPVYSGAYHLYDLMGESLVTCLVTNPGREARKVFIATRIEGITTECTATETLPPGTSRLVVMNPPLIPGRIRALDEATKASLASRVSYMKGEAEVPVEKKTVTITMLARDTLVYIEKNPYTGKPEFLFYTLPAWITPHMRDIDGLLRRAAEHHPDKKLVGYQVKDIHAGMDELAAVPRAQAKAIYELLQKEVKLCYINPSIEYGTDESRTLAQRSRIPRDIISDRSANCLESTVIFATLLEAAHLNPVIIILSAGHAFVGWEKWSNSGEYDFLKTTDIAKGLSFEEALKDGNSDYRDAAELFRQGKALLINIPDLRNRGIIPME